MASIIKERLKELCSTEPALSVLWAQWTFDEQLISKALNNVSQIFPHYSLHDASHSNQIVTNIERILGVENINSLSATDLWLILEASFCHDLGMVIPMDKIREDWETPEFTSYLNSLSTDSFHEFHTLGKKYTNTTCMNIFNHSQWPLDTFEDIRLLMADFYRGKHATRSGQIVQNPWQEINLNSPRNELLPTRLFKILGAISSHHGYSFEEVMQLPKKEVGVGNDEANPRYIACLLRLGDLLDLDDNRFCPVMLKTAGTLPLSTHSHIEKHMSIEHFRMDQNRIEVHAICETYDGYAATLSWFKYLEKEINQQMMRWDDIVPDKKMGLLPTIGNLDIQLKDYELLSKDKAPKFEIDEDKMLDLLQGAGLYNKPIQCIREMLQNAADATLLKFWCDKKIIGKYNDIDFEKPPEEITKIFNDNYKIEVDITAEKSTNDMVTWKVAIKDQGIGIDKESLSFLQKIGSSNKDHKKHQLINSMPQWLQPSGAFGIGFQSIFMITDHVTISTKGFYGGEVIIVEMDNPNKSKSSNIFIKVEKDKFKYETGTLVEFYIENPKSPSGFTYSFDEKNVCSEINNYDFIEGEQLNVEILQLIHQVTLFAENSYVPIGLKFEGSDIEQPNLNFNDAGYFDALGFRIQLIGNKDNKRFTNTQYHSRLLFKGQRLETIFPTSFCYFDIDIIGYKANDILEINRNKIKKDKQEELFTNIDKALINYFNCGTSSYGPNEGQFIDAFLITVSDIDSFLSDTYQYNDTPAIDIVDSEVNSKSIVESDKVVFKLRQYEIPVAGKKHNTVVTKEGNIATVITDGNHHNETLKLLQQFLLCKHFKGIKLDIPKCSLNESDPYLEKEITYFKESKFEITRLALKHALTFNENNDHRWPRISFLCPDDFIKLAVKKDKIGFCEGLLHRFGNYNNYPELNMMILPFKSGDKDYKPYSLDKLIEWTFNNRINDTTGKEEISGEYTRFIQYVHKIMDVVAK